MILLKSSKNSAGPKSPKVFLSFFCFFFFFLKCLAVADFTVKSMIRFELIFMRCETWLKVYFFAHQCLVGPHHLKRPSFLPVKCLCQVLVWVCSRFACIVCVRPSLHHTSRLEQAYPKSGKRVALSLFCSFAKLEDL